MKWWPWTCQATAPSMRGNSPASVPAMAAACRQDLADRGLEPPYAFVGMSLGGMVALHGRVCVRR